MSDAVTNTNTGVNPVDYFYNIIYDKEIKSYNIDKFKNSYNLLYFTIPKEEKFYPDTEAKLTLLKFLYSHNEIQLDANLDIKSPTAITDMVYYDRSMSQLCLSVDRGVVVKLRYEQPTRLDDKQYRFYCPDYQDRWDKEVENALYRLNRISAKIRYDWHRLCDRKCFTANYTPLSTRDLFDKIISVLTKHYNYNIKEIQFEPVYSCLLNKVI